MCLSATLLHQWSLLSPVSSTFPSLLPCPAHVSMLKHTHVLLGGKFLPFILSSPSPTTLSFFFLSWLLFICFVVVCGYLVGVYIYGLHEMFWYRRAIWNKHDMENGLQFFFNDCQRLSVFHCLPQDCHCFYHSPFPWLLKQWTLPFHLWPGKL